MAVATLTPGFTVLSTCDTTTGWVGTMSVDTEFFKQGTASLGSINRTNGLNTRYFAIPATNMSSTHLRLWFSFAAPGFIAEQALGGIRLWVSDGANTGYWYLGGKDTYGGGWTLLTVDTARAFDSGTCNRAAVTQVGFAIQLTAAPRNSINTWVDYLAYGNGVTATGGTDVDPIKMSDIFAADELGGYGAVQRTNGVYFISTNLTIGSASTSTNTYFEDSGQILVFENQPVSSTLYNLTPVGSATNITSFKLSNSVVKSASTATRFQLPLDNANLDILTFDGNTITNAGNTTFKAGQSANNCVWSGSNRIVPTSATITGCTISNSTDPLGALLLSTTHNVTESSFLRNAPAINIPAAGTYTFSGLNFSGNTFDILNSSGGSVVVNVTNGGNATSFTNSAGGTTAINNAATLTLTGIVSGSEVRIYSRTSGGASDLELGGAENVTTGEFAYTYNYVAGTYVNVVIFNTQYQYYAINNLLLGSTSSSIPVQQISDRQYANPT